MDTAAPNDVDAEFGPQVRLTPWLSSDPGQRRVETSTRSCVAALPGRRSKGASTPLRAVASRAEGMHLRSLSSRRDGVDTSKSEAGLRLASVFGALSTQHPRSARLSRCDERADVRPAIRRAAPVCVVGRYDARRVRGRQQRGAASRDGRAGRLPRALARGDGAALRCADAAPGAQLGPAAALASRALPAQSAGRSPARRRHRTQRSAQCRQRVHAAQRRRRRRFGAHVGVGAARVVADGSAARRRRGRAGHDDRRGQAQGGLARRDDLRDAAEGAATAREQGEGRAAEPRRDAHARLSTTGAQAWCVDRPSLI